MYDNSTSEFIRTIICEPPYAGAVISGSETHPNIYGEVFFYNIRKGTLILADISGLPKNTDCERAFFGFHIHAGASCTGTAKDPFEDTKGHYNPQNTMNPCHAGDLPVLLSNQGHAWILFYTNAFRPSDLIGKTAVIHDMPDDYRTQPAGNAGIKIACGEILSCHK